MKQLIAAMALVASSATWGAPGTEATGDITVQLTYTPGCWVNVTNPNASTSQVAFGQGTIAGGRVQIQCSAGLTHFVGLRRKGSGLTPVAAGAYVYETDNVLNLPYVVSFRQSGSEYLVEAEIGGGGLLGCPGGGSTACTNTGATNNVFEMVVTF